MVSCLNIYRSKLIIYFLKCIFKWPQYYSFFRAIEDARAVKWALGQPVAYLYITRDANCITDDMARWKLEA